MLEIVALVFLCLGNSKRAKQRGRSGGGAVAYTLGLWIGLEIIGIILAFTIFSGSLFYGNLGMLYLFGLGLAAIGGAISYVISKQGDAEYSHVEPHTLITPCTVLIYRDPSEKYSNEKLFFYLNGDVLDILENDSMLIAKATKSHNKIAVRVGEEQFMRDTYEFIASPNGVIKVHCAGGKFLDKQTKTISDEPKNEW